MMHVGRVVVLMSHRVVPMRVAVLPDEGRIVHVLMVAVVVDVRMLVNERRMPMRVGVSLREVERDARAAQRRASHRRENGRPVAQGDRHERADERRRREDRRGPSGTERALGRQIEPQAGAVPNAPAGNQRRGIGEGWR
jgi:hypothetical protein